MESSSQLKTELESTSFIAFSDCDPFRHLNNGRYIDYFLTAREQHLLEAYNFSLADWGKKGRGWFVTQNLVAYLKPANYAETVIMVSRIIAYTDFELHLEMVMLAAGVSPVVLTDQLSRAIALKAKSNHNLYQLLDELVDIPKAHDPQLKLIATLVRFAKPTTHKTVASHAAKTPSFAAKPAQLRTQAAARMQAAQAVDEPKKASPKPAATPSKPESESAKSAFDWDQVLATIKKHHAPLYSVLSRAEYTYDDSALALTLTFNYVLHRKKLENPTYRKQLGSVIYNLFGLKPELIITDIKSAAALDEDAQAVAVIMGGGEPIRGTI